MSLPAAHLLRARDLRAALLAVGDIAGAAVDIGTFATIGVQVLNRLAGSELTTLSRCDLRNGRREVLAAPPKTIGHDEQAAFDRHFNEHPLVRYHALARGPYAHRISDSLSESQFRASALYGDYYRRVGLSHALALPVKMDGRELVSFVLNRQGRDFADRELALLDALRRPLAQVFARLCATQRPCATLDPPALARHGLTPREVQVLQWVALGKTDRDIAGLLECSPNTVHKHLQRVYTKLGVENRTAAVMRAIGHGLPSAAPASALALRQLRP